MSNGEDLSAERYQPPAATRRSVGVVSVDAGCVEIRRDADRHGANGWAVQATSGFGDGGYPVVTLDGADGVVGIEAVFILDRAEDAGDEALAHAGLTELPDKPGMGDADAVARWWEVYERRIAIQNDAYFAALAIADPNEDATPTTVGEVLHDGGPIEVTDPYCGSTGPTIDGLPAGRYVTVRWEADHEMWGRRCHRLGVYRAA